MEFGFIHYLGFAFLVIFGVGGILSAATNGNKLAEGVVAVVGYVLGTAVFLGILAAVVLFIRYVWYNL